MVQIKELEIGTALTDAALDFDDHWIAVDDVAGVETERYPLSHFVHGYEVVTGPDTAGGAVGLEGTVPQIGDLVLLSRSGDTWIFANSANEENADYFPARKVDTDLYRFLPLGEPLRWTAHKWKTANILGFDEADEVLFLQDDNTLANAVGAATLTIRAARVINGDSILFLDYDRGVTGGTGISGSIASTQVAIGIGVDLVAGFANFTFNSGTGNVSATLFNGVDPADAVSGTGVQSITMTGTLTVNSAHKPFLVVDLNGANRILKLAYHREYTIKVVDATGDFGLTVQNDIDASVIYGGANALVGGEVRTFAKKSDSTYEPFI